jgi:apolipoprotein N-acyltransferase
MLLVMFGEYIPFADYFPDNFFLKTLCQRADSGKKPVALLLLNINDKYDDKITNTNLIQDEKYIATTNICFESSSSHLIRQQLLTLKEQGEEPDILINISNDGWFNHSSLFDMHLATHIFRAIENRKPYLAATNGGFSVGIDGSGNILAIGQRKTNQVVYVDMTADNRFSPYIVLGSIFHFVSLGCIIFMLLFSFFCRKIPWR